MNFKIDFSIFEKKNVFDGNSDIAVRDVYVFSFSIHSPTCHFYILMFSFITLDNF